MDHRSLNDVEFARQFADASMNPEFFTHEAHLRLAWIILKKHDLPTSQNIICDQIKHFDRVHGDGTKFNDGVTRKCVSLVSSLIEGHHYKDFEQFMHAQPRLTYDLKGLLSELTLEL